MFPKQSQNAVGFTLFEILIAMFIFAILSLLLASGLRTVMNVNQSLETNAAGFRAVQRALLIFSRDIEQTVNRPSRLVDQAMQPAFVGKPLSLTFTHAGYASDTDSHLQRVTYAFQSSAWTRTIWHRLDPATETVGKSSVFLQGVTSLHFEYLDSFGRFHDHWPLTISETPLPKAVRLSLTIPNWGNVSQLYVIAAFDSKA